jgi:hypothetical protein
MSRAKKRIGLIGYEEYFETNTYLFTGNIRA